MTLRVYNTLARRKEEFVPLTDGRVTMYVCGPTVYNHIHIGNARTFISFDMIRKYLEHCGYEVIFVQNVTDVDDKIINRAKEEGRPASEVAAEYTTAFIDAMHALGIDDPTFRPKATEMIEPMLEMTQRLVDSGHAYEINGDVYFRVRSFAGYGKLSGRNLDDAMAVARVDVDERKEDPFDFALWKSAKPGEPHWSSPWGEGRPGWHLECSAMSEKLLGKTFDIHGGGADLIFPHHENEIAQSEAANGVPFARYWLHGGMLNINAEKMSKSLGNFRLLKDIVPALTTPAALRLLTLQTHYRSSLDFSEDRLTEAASALDRIATAVGNARWTAANADECNACAPLNVLETLRTATTATRERFASDMDDDFNTASALGAIFDLVRVMNGFVAAHGAEFGLGDAQAACDAADTAEELLEVLGVHPPKHAFGSASFDMTAESDASESLGLSEQLATIARDLAGYSGTDDNEAIQALLDARAEARASKDWSRADAVRDGLIGLGFQIEDTPQGARVTYGARD